MASYGPIYEFAFDSQNGADILIVISKKEYVGDVTRRPLGRAPILKRENNGHIYGTSLEIYAECKVDGEYAEFYTSSADEFKVEVWKSEVLIWSGFITPELYSEPDIAPPYDVQIIATDGLGELKNYTFASAGIRSIYEHLRSMLDHVELARPYTLISNLTYDDDGQTAPVELFNVRIDLEHEIGESCYDILQHLLVSFNASITFHNGVWVIFRETDLIRMAGDDWLPGVQSNGLSTVLGIVEFGSMANTDWWPIGQMTTTIEPAKKSLVVEAPNHYKSNALSPQWTVANGASYNAEERAYILPDEGSFIEQRIDFGENEVGYRLGLRIRALNVGEGDEDQGIGVMLKVDAHVYSGYMTYYLLQHESSDRGPGSYYWHIKEGWIEGELAVPTSSDTANDAQDVDIIIPLYDSRRPNFNTSSWIYARAIDITIFNPKGTHDINVYDVSLVKYEQTEGYQANVNIANVAREVGDTVTTSMTDGSMAPAEGYIFQSGIPLFPDRDVQIQAWSVENGTSKEYLQMISEDYAMAVALPRMEYRGKLNVPLRVIPFLFRRDGTYYFPRTYTYDLYNDELEVDLISIPSAELSVESLKIAQIAEARGVPSSGGSGSGGGIGSGIDLSQYVTKEQLATMWKLDEDGNVYTERPMYSLLQVSAGGIGTSGDGEGDGGGTGEGFLLLNSWPASGDYSSYALGANLGIELNERLKRIEDGEITPDLTGYATQDWVLERGYLTQSVADGRYLKLIGGAIGRGGTNSFPLQVESTSGYTGIAFVTSGGTGWMRYSGGSNWGVTDAGWQNSYTLIHSGNIGSQSVASATKLADNTAFTAWGQTFFENGKPKNVTGTLKTPSGYNAVSILDSYLVLGQGMAENSKPTYLDGYNVYMRYGNSSTIGLTLNSSGNVGIGSSSPAHKFHVNGTSGLKATYFHHTTGTASDKGAFLLQYYNTGTDDVLALTSRTGAELAYKSSILDVNWATGNIGIGGISKPQYKLDVNGVARASGLIGNNVCIACGSDGTTSGYSGEINRFGGGNLYIQGREGGLMLGFDGNTTTVRGMLVVNRDVTIGNSTSGTLKIGGATLSWDDANKALKIDTGFYSLGQIAAGGIGTESEGSGSGTIGLLFDSTKTWADYTSDMADYALAAYHGKALNDRLDSWQEYFESQEIYTLYAWADDFGCDSVGSHLIPDASSLYDLGSKSGGWRTLYVHDVDAQSGIFSDLIVQMLSVGGNILPSASNALNLGSSSWWWKNVYATNVRTDDVYGRYLHLGLHTYGGYIFLYDNSDDIDDYIAEFSYSGSIIYANLTVGGDLKTKGIQTPDGDDLFLKGSIVLSDGSKEYGYLYSDSVDFLTDVTVNGASVATQTWADGRYVKIDGSSVMTGGTGLKWDSGGGGNSDNFASALFVGADTSTSSSLATSKRQWTAVLNVGGIDNMRGYRFQLASYVGPTDNQLYYRGYNNNGSEWKPWKTIAFTDSNVASATKLATARTIWGQSFDGTGNVSGDLYLEKGCIRGKDNKSIIGADRVYNIALGYGCSEGGGSTFIHGKQVALYRGTSHALGFLLNESGNVTIGSSDLAGTDYKLVVNGLSRFKNNVESDGNVIGGGAVQAKTSAHGFVSLQVGSTGNKGLLDSRTSSWFIYTDGANTFLPQGNIGIGTTSPQYKLHVNGNLLLAPTESTQFGGFVSFGYHGAELREDFTSAFRTSVFGETSYISRFKTIKTIPSIDNLCSAYGSGVAWTSADTNGYLSVAYNTGDAFIGGGYQDELRWYAKLLHNKMSLVPATDTSYNIGSATNRYINAYLSNSIRIGSAVLSWDSANNALKIEGNVYATGQVASGGIGAEGDNIATYNKWGGLKPAYSTTGTAKLTTASQASTDNPTIAVRSTTAGRYYAVEMDAVGRAFVNVPWVNTNYWTLDSSVSRIYPADTARQLCVGGTGSTEYGTSTYKLVVHGSAFAISGTWQSSSDMTMKDVVKDIDLDIKDIANAPSFAFTWKGSEDKTEWLGTSAQYWKTILPTAVKGEEGSYSLSYGELALTTAIAIAKKTMNHEDRIKELELQVKTLKDRLSVYEN